MTASRLHRCKGLRRNALALLVASAALVAAGTAWAQATNWPIPGKPIRIVLPFPAGSGTDGNVRTIAKQLQDQLGGHPVIVDNKPGAGTFIGAQEVARATPDGHTLLYTIVITHTQNPHLYAKLPYDALTDFEPVSLLGFTTLGLAVPQASGLKTLDELVRHVKANPGKTTYASFGIGSTAHIYGEMFNGAAGLDMAHVPYKGTAPATVDVAAGRATAGYIDFASMGPMIQGGKLLVLAVTGTQRWPQQPTVPTFGELGYPLDLPGWAGIMAPKSTPRLIIERMSQEITKIMQTAEGKADMLEKGGIIAVGSTPGEFADRLQRDAPRWGEAFAKSGVKPQE
jgi:tripartite-type tricarboxylate transporter receptor subunit TctC